MIAIVSCSPRAERNVRSQRSVNPTFFAYHASEERRSATERATSAGAKRAEAQAAVTSATTMAARRIPQSYGCAEVGVAFGGTTRTRRLGWRTARQRSG